MVIVSYGGGTNSVAMLVGMRERGIIPDHITFADTGGEKPNTYEHLEYMRGWCSDNGFPDIVTVKTVDITGEQISLEDWCQRNMALPSIAYGFKSCSEKHKIRPQNKYYNNMEDAKAIWANGGKIIKYVGFDADEPHRAKRFDDPKYDVKYPLIEWGYGRAECINSIEAAGIPLPGKSSCFFCPSMRQSEIRELAAVYPDLMDRAIAMENNAELTHIKGLGRSFAWRDVIATDDMFPENYIEQSCGCYDG